MESNRHHRRNLTLRHSSTAAYSRTLVQQRDGRNGQVEVRQHRIEAGNELFQPLAQLGGVGGGAVW